MSVVFSLSTFKSEPTILVLEISNQSWKVSLTNGTDIWSKVFPKTECSDFSAFAVYQSDPNHFENLLSGAIAQNHEISTNGGPDNNLVVKCFSSQHSMALTLLPVPSSDRRGIITQLFFKCLKTAKSCQFVAENSSQSTEPLSYSKPLVTRQRRSQGLPGLPQVKRR
ncbi:hypothetical protein RCL1_006719 [Eukaryota sp. TZLM3-RCL]